MKLTIITLISISLLTSCGKTFETHTDNPASRVEIGNKTITIITGSNVQPIR